MPITLAIVLGIVQGLTEFLPVSSSGHLVVFQHYLEPLFGASKTPLAFDVFVHLATLLVILFYLRDDVKAVMLHPLAKTETGAKARQLVVLVLLGTVPAAIVGLGFKEQIESAFGSVGSAANGFLLTTLLLVLAHLRQRRGELLEEEEVSQLGWDFPTLVQALLIGCAQAVAVFPGVSRSGATIAAALILGLSGVTAIRFSFLLFIPAVAGAMILELEALVSLAADDAFAYLIGFLVTTVVGWLALLGLVRVVRGANLCYFAAYTFVLGVVLHWVS